MFFLCVVTLKVRDRLLHAQKHGHHGKTGTCELTPPTPPVLAFTLLLSLQPVISDHGLLTTVAYKLGKDEPACYALEVGGCPPGSTP